MRLSRGRPRAESHSSSRGQIYKEDGQSLFFPPSLRGRKEFYFDGTEADGTKVVPQVWGRRTSGPGSWAHPLRLTSGAGEELCPRGGARWGRDEMGGPAPPSSQGHHPPRLLPPLPSGGKALLCFFFS